MMNYGISVLFRAIPVFMAFICFFLGGFIFLYGPDPAKYVAGPVVFFFRGDLFGFVCHSRHDYPAIDSHLSSGV